MLFQFDLLLFIQSKTQALGIELPTMGWFSRLN